MSGGNETRRFVLLRHELPESASRASHYDLMLERVEGLFTLELADLPEPGVEVVARELPLHRKAYLEYEGPVSGDRGSVRRVDRGAMTIDRWSDDRIVVMLAGERFAGRLSLQREAPSDDESRRWVVRFDAV